MVAYGTTQALNGVSVCIYMLCMLSVPAARKVMNKKLLVHVLVTSLNPSD